MKKTTKLLVALFALIPAIIYLPAWGKSETYNESQSYELNKTATLSLDFKHANLEIHLQSGNNVAVTISQTLRRGDPEQCIQKLIEKRGNGSLEISTYYEQRSWKNANCEVSRQIVLELGHGQIEKLKLSHKHGNVRFDKSDFLDLNIQHAHGNLNMESITGDKAKIDSAHGNADVGTIDSASVLISGKHGNVQISHLKSDKAELDLRHGNLLVEDGDIGQLNAQNAHGAIKLSQHKGNTVNINNAHGAINVTSATTLPQVDLRNSHGPIEFKGSADKINTSNRHGATTLTQTEKSEFNVTGNSAHGNITIKLIPGSGNSEISTSSRVNTPQFQLSASHGQINIKENR